MKRVLRRAVLVLTLMAGTAGAVRADCPATLEGAGLAGDLVGTFTHRRWTSVVTSDLRVMVLYAEVEVGMYRMDDGSLLFLQCGVVTPEYVVPE